MLLKKGDSVGKWLWRRCRRTLRIAATLPILLYRDTNGPVEDFRVICIFYIVFTLSFCDISA